MPHSGSALIDPKNIFDAINLTEGMRVADFGCGRTGHFIFLASKMVGETGVVYAMDILKDVLASIASRSRSEGYHNIQTVWTNVEKVGATPIPEATLDGGFLVNTLFMMEDKKQTLQEVSRLLKKDGWLVVVDWFKKIGPLGPEEGKMLKKDELLDMAGQNGLKSIQEFNCGEHHFCIIFKK
jgi:ubiquinone/menaquinone biosynthesis C-methylase UbiE